MKKWIGLFNVKPLDGNTYLNQDEVGAFVNVLALAKNEKEFIKNVADMFKLMDFEIEECKKIDLYERRIEISDVDEEIKDLAKSLNSRNPIAFDVFHTYPEDKD